jgi:ribosome recycling factor
MKKDISDTEGVLRVRATPEDAGARVRRLRKSIHDRVKKNQSAPLLSDAERDLLLLAVAQKLGIL